MTRCIFHREVYRLKGVATLRKKRSMADFVTGSGSDGKDHVHRRGVVFVSFATVRESLYRTLLQFVGPVTTGASVSEMMAEAASPRLRSRRSTQIITAARVIHERRYSIHIRRWSLSIYRNSIM